MKTPCQIVRREDGTEDDYGNVIPAETTVQALCAFQKQNALGDSEDGSRGNLAESGWNVFFPVGTDVEQGDAVIVDGREYEVDGEPYRARNELTGSVSHVECAARRVAGADD